VKTAGSGKEPEDSPVGDQTVTVGRAAILLWEPQILIDMRSIPM
jgi:hypothetical protein